ncbi:putative signal transducing protein [Falsiroseomonas sp. E2-1-a20]|uniref:putative signal transducing protein n=1 Tax=Falsiroseomonas sp. E2-1-a20 TaxID=3239300 RepID=UPI003F3AE3A1
MRVLLATTNPIRLSFLMALLRDAGYAPVVLDGHVSAIEGGIGIFPRRLAVPEDQAVGARRLLAEAGESDGLA